MDPCVRWHKSDCSKPRIIVDDGVPRCLSCDSTSSDLVRRLVSQNQIKEDGIFLPEEAPLGEAALWWPPSVPYRCPQADIRTDSEPSDDRKEATELSGQESKLSSLSRIYPAPLDSSHFRLIYLTGFKDQSSPIHMQLEEYPLDDCPEYETVSYVWGGEEDDSTPRKPVYVGSFWDVVLATNNCSALLNYLRPQLGSRTIWVDAICINQANNIEKPAQISRMGDIYANCERVVAYFGEDLVSRPPGRTFRPRIDFHEPRSSDEMSSSDGMSPDENEENAKFLKACAESAGVSQNQLLERRYLTRMWIVQELLLSKRAIFPLGDLDILCDRKEAMNLVLRGTRERFAISAVDGKSLSHLLKATSHCHASDPRDRVYGLLGLFEPEEVSRRLLPSYSLSWRDCWLGTAAYMLLVEKNLVLLAHATGIHRPTYMPSWVPDFQNAGSWFDDFKSTTHDKYSRISEDGSSPKEVSTTAFGNWRAKFLVYSVDDDELKCCSRTSTQRWRKESHRWKKESHRWIHAGALLTQSIDSASINSSNGALQLQVLRVFDGPCQLMLDTKSDGLTSIRVLGSSTAAEFRVMRTKPTTALDSSYHLFIISCQDLDYHPIFGKYDPRASRAVLLALATMPSGNDSTCFILHDCSLVYDVHFYSVDRLEAKQVRIDNPSNFLRSVNLTLHILKEVLLRSYTADSFEWTFTFAFPSFKARTQDIMPLMICLTEPGTRQYGQTGIARSIAATAETICPEFNPVIQGVYYHLTVKNRTMLSHLLSAWGYVEGTALNLSLPLRMYEMPASYHTNLQNHAQWTERCLPSLIHELGRIWDPNDFPVLVRFCWHQLVTLMEQTITHEAMCRARGFSSILNEDLETLLNRRPTLEDSYIFHEGWGQRLVEQLSLAWKLERITLV